jgi:hypothetical protein
MILWGFAISGIIDMSNIVNNLPCAINGLINRIFYPNSVFPLDTFQREIIQKINIESYQ